MRVENNTLRYEMVAERKRLADLEASLRARASSRNTGAPSGGFMSNKKVSESSNDTQRCNCIPISPGEEGIRDDVLATLFNFACLQ